MGQVVQGHGSDGHAVFRDDLASKGKQFRIPVLEGAGHQQAVGDDLHVFSRQVPDHRRDAGAPVQKDTVPAVDEGGRFLTDQILGCLVFHPVRHGFFIPAGQDLPLADPLGPAVDPDQLALALQLLGVPADGGLRHRQQLGQLPGPHDALFIDQLNNFFKALTRNHHAHILVRLLILF